MMGPSVSAGSIERETPPDLYHPPSDGSHLGLDRILLRLFVSVEDWAASEDEAAP
jgi:hypothetical protein